MLKGKCPKCATLFFGRALTDRQYQTCPECGVPLDFKDIDQQGAEKQLPGPTEASPANPMINSDQTNEKP